MDWYEWHKGYEESTALKQRLDKVRELIAGALDAMAPGPISILSICAGDGRDLISALRDHPRRGDVTAKMLELDPRLVDQGRDLARTASLEGQVEFDNVDATRSDAYDGRIPCQLTLACGVLGNIAPETTASFIGLASAACAPGGTFIWTRLLSANNGATHTPVIRQLLDAAGFEEARFDILGDDDGPAGHFTQTFGAGRFVVAAHIQRGTPGPVPRGELFKFLGFSTLLKESGSEEPHAT